MTERTEIRKQEEFVRLDWRLTGQGEIPCQVRRGLWPRQVGVTLSMGERKLQFFAHESCVETERTPQGEERINGWVRVIVQREKEDYLVVIFPGEPVNSGPTTEIPKNLIRGVKVPKSLIHQLS